MIEYVFYNVKSSGEMEEVNKKKSAFNTRRTIVVQDPFDRTIWIVHGTNVSDKVRSKATMKAKELNGKLGFQFRIVEVDMDKRNEQIAELLKKKGKTSKLTLEELQVHDGNGAKELRFKREEGTMQEKTSTQMSKPVTEAPKRPPVIVKDTKEIPKAVAPVKRGEKILPKGDLDKGGPMIEEFQITFDDSGDGLGDLGGVVELLTVLDRLSKSNASKEVARKELHSIVDEIVDRYF